MAREEFDPLLERGHIEEVWALLEMKYEKNFPNHEA